MRKVLLTSAILTVFAVCVCAEYAWSEDLTPELCKEKATAAAKLIEQKGEAAFAEIKDPNGPFRFADGKGYIWIQTSEPAMVMHPIKPELDGKNLAEDQDVNGVHLFVAFSDICAEHGAGWVPYSWPKPGEEKESPKVSYVIKAKYGDKEYIAGCGMYDVTGSDIKTKFPNDAVYEE